VTGDGRSGEFQSARGETGEGSEPGKVFESPPRDLVGEIGDGWSVTLCISAGRRSGIDFSGDRIAPSAGGE